MKAIDKVLAAIPGKHKQAKDGYMVSCPCDHHKDKNPSCEIKPNKNNDGFHIKCYSGCCSDNDLTAGLGRLLGVEWKNAMFFDRYWNEDTKTDTEEKTPHPTWEAARDAMRWSVEQHTKKKVVKTDSYLFAKADGTPVGYELHFRFADGTKEPRPIHTVNGEWFAGRGLQRWPLFNLPNLPLANGEAIFQHEGPKAAQAGIDAGLPSTCCMGGSGNPDFTDHAPLAGKNVGICLDNDNAGEKFGKRDTEILHDLETPAQVRLLRFNGRPEGGGDFADLLAECQDADAIQGLRQEVEELFADTKPESVTPKAEPGLLLQKFSDIQEREINWLWKNRIIIGGVTIITGPVGNTKSLLTIDLATRVSLGSPHPDGSGTCPKGEVLILGHEDDHEAVQKPRLVAAGADCDKVYYVHGKVQNLAEDTAEDAERLQLEHDIKLIKKALQQKPNIKLLVFDPLPEFIGGDHNSSAEVRSALMPLTKVAQEFDIAVIAICHQNKKQGLSAVQTIAGSGGFSQVARTILAVLNDPEDDDKTGTRRRVMVVAKSNNGGQNEAQAYRLKSSGNDRVRIEWLPEIFDVDAEELIKRSRQQDDGRRTTFKRDAATDDLQRIMANGPLESKEIDHRMRESGHSGYQIRQARSALELVKVARERNTDPWKYDLPADRTGTFSIDDWPG